MEHTHLVKGLDYALLHKVRSEIDKKPEDEDDVDAKAGWVHIVLQHWICRTMSIIVLLLLFSMACKVSDYSFEILQCSLSVSLLKYCGCTDGVHITALSTSGIKWSSIGRIYNPCKNFKELFWIILPLIARFILLFQVWYFFIIAWVIF